jgi:hypothetical protein
MESLYEGDQEHRDYKKATSIFIPWTPKQIETEKKKKIRYTGK